MMREKEPINFLLVDDLEENLLALEALLQRDGLVCLKARSGDEALELLLVHDVALALLDVQMPGMDGFQLAEFMRGASRARHIPIIFVTAGSADAQRKFRGYEAGAVDFIQKPIEADILRSKADVFFDLHQQHRQILAQRDELAAFANALRTADRHKNAFLAVLGHELRNPVMALGAGLHLLKRREDPNQVLEIRAQMDRQVQHLARLVEDLLDISRIDQGKLALRKEKVALQSVLGFAVEASQP
ncbi:MAG: response regulator, partial [Phenylobacterium sp.]|uniref:hybrid sensor histidine kinase/response regulator n=1 Tax=Phenylobacterium sp. TaxID=1871053 RepID=UPI0027216AAC